MSDLIKLIYMLKTYTSHVDGTPERTSNTSTKNEEGSVNKELISRATEEQKSVGRSLLIFQILLIFQKKNVFIYFILYLEKSLLSSNVVGSVDERHFFKKYRKRVGLKKERNLIRYNI